MTGPLAVFTLGAFVSCPSPPYLCTDRDGRRQAESPTHRARSSVTTKQCNTQARQYQHVPRWEIYLRTVTFSAEQPRTGTHRWLILSRRRPVYHSPVTETYYSNSLLSHSSGQSCREQRKMQQGSGLSTGGRKSFLLQHIISYFSPFSVFRSLLTHIRQFTGLMSDCLSFQIRNGVLSLWNARLLAGLFTEYKNACFCRSYSAVHQTNLITGNQ